MNKQCCLCPNTYEIYTIQEHWSRCCRCKRNSFNFSYDFLAFFRSRKNVYIKIAIMKLRSYLRRSIATESIIKNPPSDKWFIGSTKKRRIPFEIFFYVFEPFWFVRERVRTKLYVFPKEFKMQFRVFPKRMIQVW